MTPTPSHDHPTPHSLARAALRAVRSTLTIGSIALILTSLQDGLFTVSRLLERMSAYRWIWFALFLGLFVWEGWLSPRRRAPSSSSPPHSRP